LIALAEIIAALLAVRGVRGDLLPYLVLWMAVPGLMTAIGAAAWLMRDAQRWTTATAVASTLLIALTLTRAAPFAPVMRARAGAAAVAWRGERHRLRVRGICGLSRRASAPAARHRGVRRTRSRSASGRRRRHPHRRNGVGRAVVGHLPLAAEQRHRRRSGERR